MHPGHGADLLLAKPHDDPYSWAARQLGRILWWSAHRQVNLLVAEPGLSKAVARYRALVEYIEGGGDGPDMDMSEPAFLNHLYAKGYCGTLLDLHNLYIGWRNGGMSPDAYLEELDPNPVEEIHLAGGDDFAGFYMDSHSGLTPPEVWRYAFDYAPRFRRLRAITFEFQETYYERLGAEALVAELSRMHELAACCPCHSGSTRCWLSSNRRWPT